VSTVAITLYHRTTIGAARAILSGGWASERSLDGPNRTTRSVWLTDRPLSASRGLDGNAVLAVVVTVHPSAFEYFEWREDGEPYRRWLIPAELLNEHGKATLVAAEPSIVPPNEERGPS
jgi:hypothetical protein